MRRSTHGTVVVRNDTIHGSRRQIFSTRQFGSTLPLRSKLTARYLHSSCAPGLRLGLLSHLWNFPRFLQCFCQCRLHKINIGAFLGLFIFPSSSFCFVLFICLSVERDGTKGRFPNLDTLSPMEPLRAWIRPNITLLTLISLGACLSQSPKLCPIELSPTKIGSIPP